MLARHLELTTFLVDFAEHSGVLDRERRLGCESLEQLDDIGGELARRLTAHDKRADNVAEPHERHHQPRPVTGAQDRVVDRAGWQIAQIGLLTGLVRLGQEADRFRDFGMHVAHGGDQFLAHAIGRAQLEFFLALVEHVESHPLRSRTSASPWPQWCRARPADRGSS